MLACFICIDTTTLSTVQLWAGFCFFSKYTATHEQVTGVPPSRDPNDATTPEVNTRENKVQMSRHSLLRKEIKLRKANEVETGE